MLKKILFLCTAVLLFTLPLLAQQDTGVITGEVLDASRSSSCQCCCRVKEHRDGHCVCVWLLARKVPTLRHHFASGLIR